eukprot:1202149-Rhodomonas_salina.3
MAFLCTSNACCIARLQAPATTSAQRLGAAARQERRVLPEVDVLAVVLGGALFDLRQHLAPLPLKAASPASAPRIPSRCRGVSGTGLEAWGPHSRCASKGSEQP